MLRQSDVLAYHYNKHQGSVVHSIYMQSNFINYKWNVEDIQDIKHTTLGLLVYRRPIVKCN
jgi:hypothetical protein